MKNNKIHVGVEEASHGYERFIDAWKEAESGSKKREEVHLNFEDFAMLASILTPKRLEILKTLRIEGAMNVKSLSKTVDRDYKNVHVDCAELEGVGLIQRNNDGLLAAPWDVIDAHFRLVA